MAGDTITLPVAGPVNRRVLILGGAAAGAYVLYRWLLARSGTDTTAAYTTTDTDYTNPAPTESTDTYSTTWQAPSTNEEWSQQAVDALGNVGIDPSAASAAIGAYLSRQDLTSDQASMIRQAWALIGKPPSGPSSFSIATSATATTAPAKPQRFVANTLHPDNVIIQWDPVTGATKYRLTVDSGVDVTLGVNTLVYRVTGLKSNKWYNAQVRAGNDIGWSSPATLSFKTQTAGHGPVTGSGKES